MPSTYSDIGQNALRAKESSNFGTRKLAFYTLACDTTSGLAANWQDSDSDYFRIVQRLQESGVELFWLGEPKTLESPFEGSDAFIFAIADDADMPVKYLEDTGQWTVLGANLDGYDNYIKIDASNPLLNRGQPVVFSMTDDGVVAGQTYYLYDWETNGGFTYIQLSETVTQVNNDGTADYPEGVGHPGEIFMLDPTPSTNPYTATFYFYDTYWSGTAGDVQWACCWDPDYKTILAFNLYDRVDPVIDYSFTIYRAGVLGLGIISTFGCC
jgi:hypothetical protein